MVCYLYSSSSLSLSLYLPLSPSLFIPCPLILGDRHRFSVDDTAISRSGGRWGGDGRQRGGKGTASVGTDAAQQHLQKGTEGMCSVYIMHRDCMPNNACILLRISSNACGTCALMCIEFNIAKCSLIPLFYVIYALQVHDTVQQLVSHDKTAPKPFAKRVVPLTQEVYHLHVHVYSVCNGTPGLIKADPFPTASCLSISIPSSP